MMQFCRFNKYASNDDVCKFAGLSIKSDAKCELNNVSAEAIRCAVIYFNEKEYMAVIVSIAT